MKPDLIMETYMLIFANTFEENYPFSICSRETVTGIGSKKNENIQIPHVTKQYCMLYGEAVYFFLADDDLQQRE